MVSHCAQLSHPPTHWHAETCHYPRRGPSETARCTSTGDHLVCPLIPLPSLLLLPSPGVAWVSHQLRTSNDHRFIVGVP